MRKRSEEGKEGKKGEEIPGKKRKTCEEKG